MKNKDDAMVKCFNCGNFDRSKSNKNWIVCPVMPIDVLIDLTSLDCENYDPLDRIHRKTLYAKG